MPFIYKVRLLRALQVSTKTENLKKSNRLHNLKKKKVEHSISKEDRSTCFNLLAPTLNERKNERPSVFVARPRK